MKNLKILILMSFLMMSAIFISCNEDDGLTENNQSVNDVVTFMGEVTDIIALTEDALNDFDSRMRTSEAYENDCKTIIHKAIQKQVIIDFGNSSCVLGGERSRKGKLVITYSGKYRTEGSRIQIDLDNYVSSNVQLFGGINVTNSGNNYYEVQIKNFRSPVTAEDSARLEGSFLKSWTAGANTTSIHDDHYEISGNYSGTDRLRQNFTGNITAPITIDYACLEDGYSFPTKGVTEIVTENFASRKIDFGQGNCDNSIVLTVQGDAQTIRFDD